uniref:Hr1 domain-containing protein n=1 Tax=Globodera pallida TaxID=36090 RepID=A0A183CGC3_GLOPA
MKNAVFMLIDNIVKELAKELKVKDGLERFLSLASLERLKLQERSNLGAAGAVKKRVRIDDLTYRLRKESALIAGAKNMLKLFGEQKKADQKSVMNAHETCANAHEKLDLIRLALKKYSEQLPQESPKVSSNCVIMHFCE